MAGRTLLAGVGSGQRELSLTVVELCSLPVKGGVTQRAVLREACRRVVWIRRFLVIPQVTTDARCA